MNVQYTTRHLYDNKIAEVPLKEFLDRHFCDLSMEQKLDSLPRILANLIANLTEKGILKKEDIDEVVNDYGTSIDLEYDWKLIE